MRIYNKRPLSHQELRDKLIKKGLEIDDFTHVDQLLRYVGYYRLVGYGLSFKKHDVNDRPTGQYIKGTKLATIANAYRTDRKLRGLILTAIESIEVAVRTVISHTMCLRYETPHWYMDDSLFNASRVFSHAGLLQEIERVTGQGSKRRYKNKELFIRHYYDNYDEPRLPASWMLAEVLSFGSWSLIYNHLNVSSDRKSISKQFDLSPETLESWLHSLVYIRNTCAHHGRLFARLLPFKPKKDKGLPIQHQNHVFNFICVTSYLHKKIIPDSNWSKDVKDLISQSDVGAHYFGFPEGWESYL